MNGQERNMSERRLTIAEQKTLTRALRRSVRFVGDGEMAEAGGAAFAGNFYRALDEAEANTAKKGETE